MITVLFACVRNAGRSQMAAALFNARVNPAKARAISADTAPAARVHAEVITVMREVGIDLAAAIPRRLTDEMAAGCNLIVTMGCGESCPVLPGVRRIEWNLPDPHGRTRGEVRHVRDTILEEVARLIETLDCGA